jgi:hypothetical protein
MMGNPYRTVVIARSVAQRRSNLTMNNRSTLCEIAFRQKMMRGGQAQKSLAMTMLLSFGVV